MSPIRTHRMAYRAYDEFGRHMRRLLAAKEAALQSAASESSTVDLLGQLVKGQEHSKDGKSQGSGRLTESEVIGNLFLFIIAGHETSANSIHFSLMFLALHPAIQRSVQDELERIFAGGTISQWDYERDLPQLLSGLLGAVLNETLRVITPILAIPKYVDSVPQPLTVEGREVLVPANTTIRICLPSVHRNPKYWPHGPPKDPDDPYFPLCNEDNDLEEFKPGRWLKNRKDVPGNEPSRTNAGADSPASASSSAMYVPVKGSYIPFSDGPRSCLGRRFAQVEVVAALAVILTQYSVELAVDEWASDKEVKQMSETEKKVIWKKAEKKANSIWQTKMKAVLTLRIRGGYIPMRFVRKGEETFRDL